jgi:tRNA 5-methylaminomethyl-2-thiouridine biosynthesis bifunctional protein
VSIEKHPYSLQDLRALHQNYPELKDEAAQLHSQWPVLVSGGHRLAFENVVLTLFFADVRIVRDLRLAADAFYLDGFAPQKNPDMWSPQTLRALSRLAAPGASAATWCVASSVRHALEETGFSVEKKPGFGSKREMLCAAYAKKGLEVEKAQQRKATIVGAGLAGAALCERLCARGWEVALVERHAEPAMEASGNLAGAFHPIVTPDDSVFARLTRAAYLFSIRRWHGLERAKWDQCGALQLSRNHKEEASQRASIVGLGLPADYAQLVTREEASAHAGVPVAAGGLWFPQAGWIQPRSLVQAQLDACGERLQRVFNKEFALEEKRGLVILATATATIPRARLRRVRGQLTYLAEEAFDPPHVVVLRGGMVLPPVEGRCVVGASFDIDDDDPKPRPESDAGNLERLQRILSNLPGTDSFSVENRVGFRTVVPDRLPIAGRIDGGTWGLLALGSRGLIWSALGAELIASQLEGEPLPLEGKLADALAPQRFARRAESRG